MVFSIWDDEPIRRSIERPRNSSTSRCVGAKPGYWLLAGFRYVITIFQLTSLNKTVQPHRASGGVAAAAYNAF